MPLKSANTTNIVHLCSVCATENTIAVATLQAGALRDRNCIAFPACVCGAVSGVSRTFTSALFHNGLVNGLHTHLVDDLAQIEPLQVANLAAEAFKPVHFYPITASTLTVLRGSSGQYGVDVTVLKTLFGEATAVEAARSPFLLQQGNDSELGGFLQDVLGATPESTNRFELIKARRVAFFGA